MPFQRRLIQKMVRTGPKRIVHQKKDRSIRGVDDLRIPAIIDKFSDRWRFFSANWPCTVMIGSKTFKSLEHAYQAARLDPQSPTYASDLRWIRIQPTGRQAGAEGEKLPARPGWDTVCDEVLLKLTLQKFIRDPILLRALLITRNAILCPRYVKFKAGVSRLQHGTDERFGRILMQARSILQKHLVEGTFREFQRATESGV